MPGPEQTLTLNEAARTVTIYGRWLGDGRFCICKNMAGLEDVIPPALKLLESEGLVEHTDDGFAVQLSGFPREIPHD